MSRDGQTLRDYGEHLGPEAEWGRYDWCSECKAIAGKPCLDLRVRRGAVKQTWRPHPQRPLIPTGPAPGRYEVATVPTRYANYPMLDFPTGWRLTRRGLIHKSRLCSYVQTWGGALCDCGAMIEEYDRIYKRRR